MCMSAIALYHTHHQTLPKPAVLGAPCAFRRMVLHSQWVCLYFLPKFEERELRATCCLVTYSRSSFSACALAGFLVEIHYFIGIFRILSIFSAFA